MRELSAAIEIFPIEGTFTISRGSKREAVVVVATITDGPRSGRGECTPYARYGESPQGVLAAVLAQRDPIARGLSRDELQQAMQPGAARNAIDCALWDLEAKRSGLPAWTLAGRPAPRPFTTAFTISLGTPETMAAKAAAVPHYPLLKLKLGGEGDEERLSAVRTARPDARLVADANEAWPVNRLRALLAAASRAGLELVEQPLPAADDGALAGLARPVPVCADESAHASATLAQLRGRYDAVNIKLDKTGGLTEALRMEREARALGLRIMAGCMVSTSLAMAPATLIATGADWADLDGALLLSRDRTPALRYDGALAYPPQAGLWG